jgi:hypothetical protein
VLSSSNVVVVVQNKDVFNKKVQQIADSMQFKKICVQYWCIFGSLQKDFSLKNEATLVL